MGPISAASSVIEITPGRSSVPTYYELRLVGEDRIYAEGAAKLVWINPSMGKSIPLPEAMRASCL